MIPALIHHVWVGDDEPSAFLKNCRDSVLRLHKGWAFDSHYFRDDGDFERLFSQPSLKRLADGRDLLAFAQRIQGYTGRHPYRAIQSDFVRVCLLYVWGGFYLDWDFYALRSLGRFRTDKLVLAKIKDSLVAEALIGCRAGDEHIGRIITEYVDSQKPDSGYCCLNLSHYVARNNLYAYPPEYFIPHRRNEATPEAKYRVTDDTYFVHCWGQNEYDVETLERLGRRLRAAGADRLEGKENA